MLSSWPKCPFCRRNLVFVLADGMGQAWRCNCGFEIQDEVSRKDSGGDSVPLDVETTEMVAKEEAKGETK